jgi:hypothetical protein
VLTRPGDLDESAIDEGRDETDDTTESWNNLQHYLRPAERWPEVQTDGQ